MTTTAAERLQGRAGAALATAIREQCCQICLASGNGPLVKVWVIRRADGARIRAQVCEGCIPDAPPRYAVLRVIDGGAAA